MRSLALHCFIRGSATFTPQNSDPEYESEPGTAELHLLDALSYICSADRMDFRNKQKCDSLYWDSYLIFGPLLVERHGYKGDVCVPVTCHLLNP